MNDTPETDGEWNRIACYDHPQFEQGIADFARKLERERNTAEQQTSYWKAGVGRQREINNEWLKEIDELKADNKRLEHERDEARFDLAYRLEQFSIKQIQLSDARKTILALQKKMSDTPETDDELNYNAFGFYTMGGFPTDAVGVEFTRQLERERDALRTELNFTIRSSRTWENDVKRISVDRDYWKAEAERWREVAK